MTPIFIYETKLSTDETNISTDNTNISTDETKTFTVGTDIFTNETEIFTDETKIFRDDTDISKDKTEVFTDKLITDILRDEILAMVLPKQMDHKLFFFFFLPVRRLHSFRSSRRLHICNVSLLFACLQLEPKMVY